MEVCLHDSSLTVVGVPYSVLAFRAGEDRAARLRRGELPMGEAVHIAGAVGAALVAAHARNVIHRDLKPENIILCKSQAVKVVDFGVAKLRGGAELTALNSIVGTVPYMAPEQLGGGSVDGRTDQFALSAILYEMLSGEMAFGGPTTVAELAGKVLHHQPPPIPGVPAPMNDVIQRALCKDAGGRFPTIEEFLTALRAATSLDVTPPQVVTPRTSEVVDELPPLPGEATTISRGDLASSNTLIASLGEAPTPAQSSPALPKQLYPPSEGDENTAAAGATTPVLTPPRVRVVDRRAQHPAAAAGALGFDHPQVEESSSGGGHPGTREVALPNPAMRVIRTDDAAATFRQVSSEDEVSLSGTMRDIPGAGQMPVSSPTMRALPQQTPTNLASVPVPVSGGAHTQRSVQALAPDRISRLDRRGARGMWLMLAVGALVGAGLVMMLWFLLFHHHHGSDDDDTAALDGRSTVTRAL
jgi:hypothetical protein